MKKKQKIKRENVAWWVYLVLIVLLVFWGFRDSKSAELLIRVLHEAFSLLIE